MNQLELIKVVKEASLSLKTVHTFTNGDVYELWNNGNIKYGAVNLAIDEIQINDDTITYSVILYFADRLLQDDENNNNIQLDGSIALEAILSLLQDNYDIVIEKPYSFIPFTQQFADYLGGVYVRCNIITNNSIDLCDIEIPSKEDNSASIDFSSIGYTESDLNPILSDLEYSKYVYDNWDSSTTNAFKYFEDNDNLVFCPNIDTSNVKNMSYMFYSNDNLRYVPDLNTSNCTNFSSTFSGCKSLKVAPQIDTSKATSVGTMFMDCTNLETVPLYDFSKVLLTSSAFSNCSKLKNIGGFKNLSVNISLTSPVLTHESLVNVINNLAKVSNKSLTIQSYNIEKLTEDEIAIATNKGWTVK